MTRHLFLRSYYNKNEFFTFKCSNCLIHSGYIPERIFRQVEKDFDNNNNNNNNDNNNNNNNNNNKNKNNNNNGNKNFRQQKACEYSHYAKS